MDFGVTGRVWEYGINNRTDVMSERNAGRSFVEIAAAKAAEKEALSGSVSYMGESYEERISKITDKTAASAFKTAYAKKMAGATDYISTISKAYNTGKAGATNFEDAFLRYDVITHVGNANISSGNWQRNDFPFWKFFDKNTSADALNDWKPEGANPSQMRSDLQRNYNSVGSGRIAILVPESLQQKMDADPEYAKQIVAKLQAWKEDYDLWDNTVAASYGMNVAEQQAGKSYVFDLDENGDVRNCTVTGPGRITVSSSEFVEARKKREAKHAEYEKLAEESALKRRQMEQEVAERYYKSSMIRQCAVKAYEKNIVEL